MDQLPSTENTRTKTTLVIVATVLITALIVGGAVFAYQKKQSEQTEKDLQAQIDKLKQDLATTQASPSASVTPSAKATATASPTATTWKTFKDSSVGIQFEYPESYGTATATQSKGEVGTVTEITFSKNSSLLAGKVSQDFDMGREARGYEVKTMQNSGTTKCIYSYNVTQNEIPCEQIKNVSSWDTWLGEGTHFNTKSLFGFIPTTTSYSTPPFTFIIKDTSSSSKDALKHILSTFKFL